MTDVKGSEAFTTLTTLFKKFKKFHFDLASKIPYSSMQEWITFADGKVEKALIKERGIGKNIKDMYVIMILGLILSVVGLWYLWGLFGMAFGGVGLFLAMLEPKLLLVLLALIGLALIMPALLILFQALLYHILSKALGGKGSYTQTMTVIVFQSAANLILSAGVLLLYAVFIGFLISPLMYAIMIYSMYLMYKGFRHVHGLSKNRAIAVVVGGYLILFGIGMAIYLLLYAGAYLLGYAY